MIILFYMNELSKCRLQYNIHIYVRAITCMLYVITRVSYIVVVVFNHLQNIKKHVYSHVQIACFFVFV